MRCLILFLFVLSASAQDPMQFAGFMGQQAGAAVPCETLQNTAQSTVTATNDLVNQFLWTYFFASNSTYTACAVAVNVVYVAATYNTNEFRLGLGPNPPTPNMTTTNIISWGNWQALSTVAAAGSWVTNTINTPKELTQNVSYSIIIQMRFGATLPSNSDYIGWRREAGQNGSSRMRTSTDGNANTGVNSDTAQFLIFSQ